ncbi:ATP-binding protein [Ignatzschineria larvae DSM 13226]|uniref:histidine kinase n=1 Tax=Ignatzschineria larvae DSM 13226 TaxID=1111732 RepID=A0ABZ3BYX6_9GAMM|nr:ATP-binding protein [Ignatzschineria larvae]
MARKKGFETVDHEGKSGRKSRFPQFFSCRRSYSLRGTLITSILLSTLLLWGMSLAITTYVSWNQTKDVLDEALVRSAQVLSQLVDRGPPPVRERPVRGKVDLEDDRFYFQVISEGRVIAKSSRAPNFPFVRRFKGYKGFANISVAGDPWRVFVLPKHHSPYEIQVGHAIEMRHEFLDDLTEELVFSGLIALITSILLNGVLVFWGLKPLTAISTQLSRLSPKNLKPIEVRTHAKEIIAIEESLNMLLTDLEIARQHERQFTADASHELRTPLSAIQMKLQLLQREKPELAGALQPLQQDIRRATHLIEHLLILARLDPLTLMSGEQLPMKPVTILPLLTDVESLFTQSLTDKAIRLTQIDQIPENVAPAVMGNEDLLLVAIKNVIGNAVKYAPRGADITITLSQELRESKAYLAITILDNGAGVDAEALSRLTQRFYRVLGTEETGSGLGLSIVKKIVELHQGSLRLRSRPDVDGFEVTLYLPLLLQE